MCAGSSLGQVVALLPLGICVASGWGWLGAWPQPLQEGLQPGLGLGAGARALRSLQSTGNETPKCTGSLPEVKPQLNTDPGAFPAQPLPPENRSGLHVPPSRGEAL